MSFSQDNYNQDYELTPDPFHRIGMEEWQIKPEVAASRAEKIRADWQESGSVVKKLGGSLLNLAQSVGNNAKNNRDDVAKVEGLLGDLGFHDLKKTEGPTGYMGMQLESSIKKYQKERGLEQDGLILNDGPTLAAIKNDAQKFIKPFAGQENYSGNKKTLNVSDWLANFAYPERAEKTELKKPSMVRYAAEENSTNGEIEGADKNSAEDKPILTGSSVNTPNSGEQISKTASENKDSKVDSSQPVFKVMDYKAPESKTDVYTKNQKDFDEIGKSLEDNKELSETQKKIIMDTVVMEGGKDKSSSANNGILQDTIDKTSDVTGISKGTKPDSLTSDEVVKVYRAYLDDCFKSSKLDGFASINQIKNEKAAGALTDTLFRHGGPEGTEIVQKAINTVKPNQVTVDKVMGSKTFEAFKNLANDKETSPALLKAISKERAKKFNNETWRSDYFTDQNLRGNSSSGR